MADGGHMEESEEINQSYEEDDLINLNSGEAVSDEDSDRPEWAIVCEHILRLF